MSNKSTFVKSLPAVLFWLFVWQIAAMLLNRTVLLASPIDVIVRLFTIWQEDGFFETVLFSFSRLAGGFLCGFLCGTICAIISSKYEWVELLLRPLMFTVKSVPVASFTIIALIWLSSSQLSIFISFLMVFPIIYNNVLGGIKSVDVKMIEMADVFKLPFKTRLLYIWFPTIKGYLMTGCSIALGLCWKAGIAAEVIGIPDGSIGERLYTAKAYLNTTDLFVWTVIIVLLSIAGEKLFMFLLKACYRRLEAR